MTPSWPSQLTSVLAVTAGVVLVAVGLLRLGWVAQFLSEPIVTGFVAGLVVLIVVGEIPALAGLAAPSGGIFERVAVLLRDVGNFHGLTLRRRRTSLAILFVGSRLAPRMPWSLIVLVGGIAASTYLDLSGKGVRVVGDVPTGIPIPSIPIVDVSLWGGIVTGGLAIAAVGIAEGLAAVRTFAPSGAVDPDTDNQEFLAHGAADLASGLFGGMGVGGSLSKTAANARAGAYTQVSGVAAAVVVIALRPLRRRPAREPAAHRARRHRHPRRVGAGQRLGLPPVHRGASQRLPRRRRRVPRRAGARPAQRAARSPSGSRCSAWSTGRCRCEVDEMGRVEGEKAAWGSVANDPTRRTYSRCGRATP